ncbi:MAG: S-adenosylmethionine decarboxylase [Myxococcota bacterium]|nr:S-adenosylmethionine decarboxylase [Myxococcota bacterium]
MKLSGIGFDLRVPPDLGEMSLDWVRCLVQDLGTVLEVDLEYEVQHEFSPQGLSLVRFGGPGHLAVHTWPEHRVLAVDIWMEPELLALRCHAFEEQLHARSLEVLRQNQLSRGEG